jgi:periplasmic divalent cation tolerance protein
MLATKSTTTANTTATTTAEVLLVFTNLPDRASAERLAGLLVDGSFAACVNILAPCRSVYRWQGSVQNDEEHPLLIKTTQARYAALESAIRQAHPYALPEIVALPIAAGLPAYLEWVAQETAQETAQGTERRSGEESMPASRPGDAS